MAELSRAEAAGTDETFMRLALTYARQGATRGEVPIGALVVLDGNILAGAHNQPIRNADPTAHAEVLALRSACTRAGNYRLPGATLYVSVEPCVMCVGALIQARIGRIVYGCAEPKAGALGSVHDVGRDGRLNHSFEVRGGVCAAAAAKLLKEFFSARRGA